ncbi:NADH-ubiquinone oxidoreductase [Talaromyces stipitatus ATCC 10500]|uniref:NADH-ubiquinone oxidoreductase n=1 Tax=Talaromyces stipitatus (strain ATCC 10500 / CBS 375.48 / QM 6759 / NRRL 1006) TaxID=441959 RepID=B8MAV9_TALSN|nr:NADH-ubiquinone oxidoreductase [Talaromyces stipitatus ATCC 10500]EED17799.1 NADH-ubiquinone oxidoreductase [Talaromyces stipitatus ATCC 10500]
MFSSARGRIASVAISTSRSSVRVSSRASYSVSTPRWSDSASNPANDPTPKKSVPNVSATNAVPVDSMGAFDGRLVEKPVEGEQNRQLQAPNRATTWAQSQKPRAEAMTGPRFEQTIIELQPQPYAAIELIHKQPVRWTKERVVSCDGGGGPLGHPRIFINTDKPEIATCGYCGLPFAHEKNKSYLKSLPSTSYPLEPTGHPAEVEEAQRITEGGYEQR